MGRGALWAAGQGRERREAHEAGGAGPPGEGATAEFTFFFSV